jgi:hypothetical protein
MSPQQHQQVIASYPLMPTHVCQDCKVEKLRVFFPAIDNLDDSHHKWCMACRQKREKRFRERSWNRRVAKVRV